MKGFKKSEKADSDKERKILCYPKDNIRKLIKQRGRKNMMRNNAGVTPGSYICLLEHFDGIIKEDRRLRQYDGLEKIRNTFEEAYSIKIGWYNIYTTNINNPTNPLHSILTLVGPLNNETYIPTGCMMDGDYVSSVNVFSNVILKGIDSKDAADYIKSVYSSMQNVVEMDTFYPKSEDDAMRNPYKAAIKCCPFYYTFYHIMNVYPRFVTNGIFEDILEAYFTADRDSINSIIDNLISNECSADMNRLYNVMTCGGTINLFN